MKKKKFLAILLATTILCGSTMGVSADETTYSGNSATANVNSNFSVAPTADLSGLIITIPANLDLVLDDSDACFKVADKVSAKGDLVDNYMLDISTPRSITYINQDGDRCNTTLKFRREISPNDAIWDGGAKGRSIWEKKGNYNYWISSELEAAKTTPDEREITIELASDNVEHAGDYNSIINFDISLQKIYAPDEISNQGYNDVVYSEYRVYGNKQYIFLGNYASTASSNNSTIEALVSNSPEGTIELPKYVKGDPNSYGRDFYYELEIIRGSIFTNNTYLKTIKIPNSVSIIEKYAFSGCSNLSSIYLTNATNVFYDTAFNDCTNLHDIYYDGTITDVAGVSINNTDTLLGDIDWSTITDTNSTVYILGHATWHCIDGDFVPANQ